MIETLSELLTPDSESQQLVPAAVPNLSGLPKVSNPSTQRDAFGLPALQSLPVIVPRGYPLAVLVSSPDREDPRGP